VTSRRQTANLASERLRALSRTAYTAAAGHLEVDPEPTEEEPARRRWAVAPRTAVAAVVAIALLAAALGFRAVAAAGGPAEIPDGWSSAQDALAGDGGGWSDGDRRSTTAAPEPGVAVPASADVGAADGPEAARVPVVVHVAGEVARPGVVELPAGARVHEAIAASGGATPEAELAAVNLARVLVDGEQVYVPAPGEVAPAVSQPGDVGAGAGPGPGRTLGLNTATAAELDALPGIGPVLAQRIVDWRTAHGRFTVVEELTEVAGIGPTLLERLRDLVAV
jgi:competence protein ComEA